MKRKQITAMITTMTMVLGITACGAGNVSAEQENKEQTEIESILNISNNDEITWSYDSQSDSWTMSVTCAVANPELPDYQGVSVNVPGAYVKGIDTDAAPSRPPRPKRTACWTASCRGSAVSPAT